MKTAVIGFPRIGKNRELKFAAEKYFKGESSLDALFAEGKAQREYSLTVQKNAGIDFTADADYKKMILKAFADSAENGTILLVTGSFYLVSEVKQMMML